MAISPFIQQLAENRLRPMSNWTKLALMASGFADEYNRRKDFLAQLAMQKAQQEGESRRADERLALEKQAMNDRSARELLNDQRQYGYFKEVPDYEAANRIKGASLENLPTLSVPQIDMAGTPPLDFGIPPKLSAKGIEQAMPTKGVFIPPMLTVDQQERADYRKANLEFRKSQNLQKEERLRAAADVDAGYKKAKTALAENLLKTRASGAGGSTWKRSDLDAATDAVQQRHKALRGNLEAELQQIEGDINARGQDESGQYVQTPAETRRIKELQREILSIGYPTQDEVAAELEYRSGMMKKSAVPASPSGGAPTRPKWRFVD